jgi:RNA binding exosome subunit
MTEKDFDNALFDFQKIETPTAEDIKTILNNFLEFLIAKCKNEKIDEILETIQDKVEDDKFGLIPFLINFIKLKRQS